MNATLSILVHGDSGVGKSRLGGTSPPPVLLIDFEGRAKYLPYALTHWDPVKESPPEPDGVWTHCVVTVLDYQTLNLVFQWLESGQHSFKSVVLDSLMAAQKRLIDRVAGTGQLQTQDWGEVLRDLEAKVKDFHDLTISPMNSVDVVVFTCGTKTVDGKRVPLLQGALRDTVAYLLDAVGYMYNSQGTADQLERNLLVQPMSGIVAKDGTDALGGPTIKEPNISSLYEALQTKVQGGQQQ